MAAVCFCPSANKSGNEEFITNFVYLERWMSCLPFVIHFQEDLPVNTKRKNILPLMSIVLQDYKFTDDHEICMKCNLVVKLMLLKCFISC